MIHHGYRILEDILDLFTTHWFLWFIVYVYFFWYDMKRGIAYVIYTEGNVHHYAMIRIDNLTDVSCFSGEIRRSLFYGHQACTESPIPDAY